MDDQGSGPVLKSRSPPIRQPFLCFCVAEQSRPGHTPGAQPGLPQSTTGLRRPAVGPCGLAAAAELGTSHRGSGIEKALHLASCSTVILLKFFVIFKQIVFYFHFALSLHMMYLARPGSHARLGEL